MKQPTQSQSLKIKQFFKEAFNRELSDAEVEEIKQSLHSLAKAQLKYKLIQKKKGTTDE